jgi:DsbC/DsbD-like thiol-disulfide interchange protein
VYFGDNAPHPHFDACERAVRRCANAVATPRSWFQSPMTPSSQAYNPGDGSAVTISGESFGVTIMSVARVGSCGLNSRVMCSLLRHCRLNHTRAARLQRLRAHHLLPTRAQTVPRLLRRLPALLWAIAALSSPAAAQDASPWTEEAHAATRLIAGAAVKSDSSHFLRAGIEIRLENGWKTYWRYPGDSGVPPTFDFAGSVNVKSVTTSWPAPELFDDGAGGHSIGYTGDVVLPLKVVPADVSRPAKLHVKLAYAACGKLCVPVEAGLTLELSGNAGSEEPTLAAAEAKVPRHAALGAAGDLAIRSVRRGIGEANGKLLIEVAAPSGIPVELFAEGPTSDWALPLPEPAARRDGDAANIRRFALTIDGVPAGKSIADATLTLTAVAAGTAIEVETKPD